MSEEDLELKKALILARIGHHYTEYRKAQEELRKIQG